ncbi:MAG TPA: hypothetical protein VGK20_02185 [Candidatus Binatia bacterium]
MARFLALAAAALLAGANGAGAAVFQVTNTNGSGAGSLHQAVLDANATPEADTITFAIPGGGLKSIPGALPTITHPLTIDGFTQAGAIAGTNASGAIDATIRIDLDGHGSLADGAPMAKIASSLTVIRGVAIHGTGSNGSEVEIELGVHDVSIHGCFIGIGASGSGLGSSGYGIVNHGVGEIGGADPADRDLLSGNAVAAVLQTGADASIEGNLIGTSAADNVAVPNGRGIVVSGVGADCRIGGLADGAGNEIAGNDGTAIVLAPNAGSATSILHNSIHDNAGYGIDLGDDGPTANDPGDADKGPNALQNSFEVTFAVVFGSKLRIEGLLDSAPGSYHVEIFGGDSINQNDTAEGHTLLATAELDIPDGKTIATLQQTIDLPSPPSGALEVTATATNSTTGATSEFCNTVEAVDGGTSITVTNTSDIGAGSLRAAILTANLDPGPNTILFAIPGSGGHTIPLLSGMTITAPVVIDGYSQSDSAANSLESGTNAVIHVALDGYNAGTDDAITVASDDVLIRGLGIQNFDGDAIAVTAGARDHVESCFLGTDVTGLIDLGNAGNGVSIGALATDTQVGGPLRSQRNILSGNAAAGVIDAGTGTFISGNLIGTDASGTAAIANDGAGIDENGNGATIGLRTAEARNTIRFNGGAGIAVSGAGATIAGNSIGDNAGLGIDLGDDGVTPNDAGDADSGANGLQNFPVLASVELAAGGTRVDGSLDFTLEPAHDSRDFTVDLYQSDACDPSGFGEGAAWLGSASVRLTPEHPSFSVTLPATALVGSEITATATDVATAQTSEFSACLALAVPLCGDASGDGKLAAGDALLALRTAVGTEACPRCVCDVNAIGGITSGDALQILRASVGQGGQTFDCPVCSAAPL